MSAFNFVAKVYTNRKFHFTSFKVVILEAKLVRTARGSKNGDWSDFGTHFGYRCIIGVVDDSLEIA